MNIHPTSSRPVSTGQSTASSTPDAEAGTPKFSRTAKDGAPGAAAYVTRPIIDSRASADERQFFDVAIGMAYGYPAQDLKRLTLLLRKESSDASMYEQFIFKQKPASVQTRDSRIVINVGSDDDGSAGQLTAMNGMVERANGTLRDPRNELDAFRQASAALCLRMAQRKNMPYAAEALRQVQQDLERQH